MDLGMEGMKAIVTGGSKGIGRETVRTLAEEGCDVAVTAASADVAPWAGKTVLKPLDGTASKDVVVFATYADAGAAILNHPTGLEDWDPERFQLVEYVAGPIFQFVGEMLAGAPVAIVASRYLGTCLEFAQ